MQDTVIPPLSIIVAEVMKFDTSNPKVGIGDLEKIIAPDKGITSELLRVSNSAYYGRSGRIKILKDALGVLGLKAAKNMVIYLSTKSMTLDLKDEMFRKYLNQYPIYAALLSQQIALSTKLTQQNEECFLAALLHTIGMSIIAINKKGHYSSMLQVAETSNLDLLKLENDSYNTNHIIIAKQAAAHWNLPEIYQKIMAVSSDSDTTQFTSDLERSTFMGSVVASMALDLAFNPNALMTAQDVFKNLGGDGSLIERFTHPEALKKIKEHPYARMASV